MKLFDSHVHYEDAQFNQDRIERLNHLKETDVKMVLNCCSDVEVFDTVLNIVDQFDFAYGSIGIHPHWTLETPDDYLNRIRECVKHPKIVAIGEMGLDYFWNEPKDLQKRIFREQLSLAKELNMPVIIHDRDAHEDTIEILEEFKPKGVLHRYSGPVEILERAFDLGMYVSFNNDLSYPEWNEAPIACLMATPWDRLLIETDCPYAAPYKRKEERCEAEDVRNVVKMIAELRGVSEEFVAQKSYENALRVYEIN
ncbi:MAG: TatD family hydrolase [Erysipelotrichaceae bacterium]|nr:TatD family hydrolase [Erysipelotrichaceae bacterium]